MNQSTVTMTAISLIGSPTDVRTSVRATRPAPGIPAAPMEAAVDDMLYHKEIQIRHSYNNLMTKSHLKTLVSCCYIEYALLFIMFIY